MISLAVWQGSTMLIKTMLPHGIRQLARLFPVLLNNPTIARMPSDEEAPTDPREAGGGPLSPCVRFSIPSVTDGPWSSTSMTPTGVMQTARACLVNCYDRPRHHVFFCCAASSQMIVIAVHSCLSFRRIWTVCLDFVTRDIGLGPLDPFRRDASLTACLKKESRPLDIPSNRS